jgi:cytoskeletal protein CcmA (bactofilin family)
VTEPTHESAASCLADAAYAHYVGGELGREELRRVEAHLVRCRRCRAFVLALREDEALRAEALRDPEAGAPPPRPGAAAAAPPGHGSALALSLTLLALAAAAAAALALLESGLPGADRPARLGWRGASAMALDLLLLVRQRAPALFDLALPIAAMASVSALLSFALSALRRRLGGPGAKALAALAILALPVEGRAHFGFHEHEDVVVEAGSVHEGTLVANARSVSIDGVVDGDLVVLAERLTVRGELRGNLFAVARELDLRGVVEGSVFAGGERARIGGEVRGDLYAAGDMVALEPAGRVGRDATIVADQVLLEGELGRDANALFAGRVEARGRLGRHLRARADAVALLDTTRIGGDVRATLPEGVEVERSPGAELGGELRTEHRVPRGGSELDRLRSPELYAWMLLHVGAGFVFGMLLHLVAPGILAVRAGGPRDLVRAFGVGLATIVAAPLALLVAAATIVGIPVALLGAAALVASLYVALVALAALVGAALLRPRAGRAGFGAALAAGLAILVVLTHLPFLGGALRVVAVLTGLGLLVERTWSAWRGRAPSGAR